jgi:hypothetical protein
MTARRKPSRSLRLPFFTVWAIAWHCPLTLVAHADFKIESRAKQSPELQETVCFIEFSGHCSDNLSLRIYGRINEGDVKAFQELSAELERNSFHVILDSTGGDLFAQIHDSGRSCTVSTRAREAEWELGTFATDKYRSSLTTSRNHYAASGRG